MLNKDEIKNKVVSEKDVKNKANTEPYFFPQHGITLQASSRQEAEEKLQETLKKGNK